MFPNTLPAMEMTRKIEYLTPAPKDAAPELAPDTSSPLLSFVQFGFGTLGRLFPKFGAKVAYRLFSTPRIRAVHKTSDELLERARMFEFLYGQQLLKGYEWGSGSETVLLVHGWESRGTALRSFVPPLLKRGYRVVALDGPAHGNSGGKRTNIIEFGGAVSAIIKQVGGVHSIIAHSFGGASTVFALRNIDPSAKVENLVLIGVPNRLSRVVASTAKTLNLPGNVKQHFRAMLEHKLGTSIDQADLANAAGKVNVKELLIVHDRYDPVVDFESAEEVFEAWDDATLLITEGYGHYRLMKNSKITERVAAFIDTHLTVSVP